MKNYFYILFLIISIVSCRDDENKNIIEEEIIPEKIDYTYTKSISIPKSERNFILEYDSNKRLIHKKGGFLSLPASTGGFGSLFAMNLGTKIVYTNNSATLTDYYIDPNNNSSEKENCVYLLDGDRILEKYIPYPDASAPWRNKKLIFKYNNNSQISEIITTFPNRSYNPNDPNDYILTYSETFEYNSSGNLLKITKVTKHNNEIFWDRTETEFSDYDNAKNPFKKLILLDDFFYRALSKNNYRKIVEKVYMAGALTSDSYYTWSFSYDTNGNLILSK